MDMEISDEESEDGQITKYDEEEEKLDKLNSAPRKSDQEDQPAELADLERCRLTRDSLAKYCMAPWFQEYVQGDCNLYRE
jgi:RNA polymerase-associated protein RTF1